MLTQNYTQALLESLELLKQEAEVTRCQARDIRTYAKLQRRAPRSATPPRVQSRPGTSRRKVLWVDDNRPIRDSACEVLGYEGFEAIPMGDAFEALRLLRSDPDGYVVVTDLMMPGLNGWVFLEQKNADPSLSAVPFVVISATPPESWPSGASAYLRKPMELGELVETLERLSQS